MCVQLGTETAIEYYNWRSLMMLQWANHGKVGKSPNEKYGKVDLFAGHDFKVSQRKTSRLKEIKWWAQQSKLVEVITSEISRPAAL